MWELDHKECWAPKNWCFWAVVLEETLESPLDYKGIKPGNPKGNQSWIFISGTVTQAKAPILWPPDWKIQLIWKDPNSGKDLRQEEKGTKGKMVGWHHWLNGHEFEHLCEMEKDRETWSSAVHGVANSWRWLSDWTRIAICSVISESLRLHVLQPSCLLSVEFSRQKYQSGLPFPSPGDLSDPKIIPGSPTLHVDFLQSEPPGKPALRK